MRVPLIAPAPAGAVSSRLHGEERVTGDASAADLGRVRRVRLIGTTGSVAMAAGALGAGALPVIQNPALGERGLGLWLRVQHASMTIAMIGMVTVVLCWLLLGRHVLGADARGRWSGRIDRRTLDGIIASWALPLALAPPMFSKDVYSYLAQGKIAALPGDPYALGPRSALGVHDALTINVPDIWRDTPNQYGPVFLGVQRFVYALTGDEVIPGVILHRLVAVGGILMLGWAVPRLAERCGVSDVAALWLATANPLVLFHLVSGIHSESLMVGFLAAGMELVLRALDSRLSTRRSQGVFVLGVVLVIASALVKLPSIVALGFVGMALARSRGGGLVAVVRAAALLSALTLVTIGVCMLATDSGFGWITKLGAATTLRSWLSPPTAIGVLAGGVCQLLGLGDHTAQILAITQGFGLLLAAAWTARMLYATYRGTVHPLGGLGLAMAGIVLCFPVVQPWYVLWALVPLAAWATLRGFRVPVIVVCALLSVFTLPPGAGLPPYVTIQSWAAVLVALGLLVTALSRVPGLLGNR